MSWLLDTCVLSEYVLPAPAKPVIAWLDAQQESQLFVSQLSLAEVECGVIKLQAQDATRARRLGQWLSRLEQRFAERTLPLDRSVLRVWSRCCAEADLAGQRLATLDALLMATAQCHGLTVVTRNVRDFARYPLVFNPWTDQSVSASP